MRVEFYDIFLVERCLNATERVKKNYKNRIYKGGIQMEEKLVIDEEMLDEDLQNDLDEEIDNNKLMAYDIAVFYNTYNLSTLMKWWGKKLVIPDFQRTYVWSIKKASEFVDSMLRGLPVPSMFFL